MAAIRHGRVQLPGDIAAQQRQLSRQAQQLQQIQTVTVSSTQFTWDSDSRTFSTEASDLGFRAGQFTPATRIKLTSRHAGRKPVIFRVSDVIRDTEGDITHWKMIPVLRDVDFTLTIWND